jgi:hypothetical protein
MNKSKRHTAACWLSMLLFAVATADMAANAQTGSCTVTGLMGDHYHQSPNFKIKVSFRDHPVSGVKVVLTSETAQPSPEVVATGDTDLDGTANFFAIRPGLYQAHIDQALLSPSQEIEVQANDGNAEEVRIEWPWSPAVTRSVRGWITSWQKDSPQNRSRRRPFARAAVQLLDLRSGKLLASTHTTTAGYYEFAVSRDGLYVVRVSEAPDPSGTAYDKAVEVARQADQESMPRLEVDHVCGGGLVELPDVIDQQDAAVMVANRSIPTN